MSKLVKSVSLLLQRRSLKETLQASARVVEEGASCGSGVTLSDLEKIEVLVASYEDNTSQGKG